MWVSDLFSCFAGVHVLCLHSLQEMEEQRERVYVCVWGGIVNVK